MLYSKDVFEKVNAFKWVYLNILSQQEIDQTDFYNMQLWTVYLQLATDY